MAARSGPSVLFCMPNRSSWIPLKWTLMGSGSATTSPASSNHGWWPLWLASPVAGMQLRSSLLALVNAGPGLWRLSEPRCTAATILCSILFTQCIGHAGLGAAVLWEPVSALLIRQAGEAPDTHASKLYMEMKRHEVDLDVA
jgi:hypothetical protein